MSSRDLHRREFARGLGLTGAAALLGCSGDSGKTNENGAGGSLVDAGQEMETTKIRLIRETKFAILCYAPQYLAEDHLKAEGFTDVQYVPKGVKGSEAEALVENNADISAALGVDWIMPIAEGKPLVVVAGLHAGCIELFASHKVRSIRDLKGKRLAVHGLGSPERFLLASIVAYIGLDPEDDIEWVFSTPNEWMQLLADDKVDAILTFPPLNYVLHASKVGHVILNTSVDDPWKHYLCCMIGARRDYVEQHPVATKKAIRAILKANELCSNEPERMADWLVKNGQATDRDFALRTLKDIPYTAWRDYDPDDTMRFYALRLREAKLIKDTPNEILERGTDWTIFNQVKNELKA
jgi:NitT/TauT family transport system substrate-binding protein